MNEELQFHPYANLFPLIEGAEFDALVEDIKKNGLRHRIVVFDGKILDGRNRYRAAKAAGIKLTGITNGDTGMELAQVISEEVGECVNQIEHLLAGMLGNMSKETADAFVNIAAIQLGRLDEKYPVLNEYWHSEEHYLALKARFEPDLQDDSQDEQDEQDHESPDQVKTTLDQMNSAAVEMNKLTSLQHHEDGRSRPATEQILSQMKIVAGEINKLPANKDVRPTICTDPERLERLEQWRRQHAKSVYGSTAGGAR